MTIFVDSGVWIDYLGGGTSAEADFLDAALGQQTILLGDLVLVEVLQGIRSDRQFDLTLDRFQTLPLVHVAGHDIAVHAARNYRLLRARGVTVRKTIDTLIATRCIVEGWSLLHRDCDYQPFITHLGLTPAIRTS